MGIFSPDTVADFVRRGDIVGVRRRLELGDDINERRSFKSTLLIEAARRGNIGVMELLLEHGADTGLVDSSRLTALHSAIDEEKSAAAIFLAQRGACANQVGFLGRTPLQCAIKKNLFEVTTELLANGAYPWCAASRTRSLGILFGPGQTTKNRSNVESKNGDAMSAHCRKSMECDEIHDLSGAIQAKHTGALSTILRAAISEGDLDDTSEIESTSDEEWRLLEVALDEEADNELCWMLLQHISPSQRGGSKHLQEVVNSLSEADLEPCAYHYAVRYSDGDLDQFRELVYDGDINKTLDSLCGLDGMRIDVSSVCVLSGLR